MMSLDECMQARITGTNSFYLGIDDFANEKSKHKNNHSINS